MTDVAKKTTPRIYCFIGPDTFSRAEKIAVWTTRFTEKYGKAGISVFDLSAQSDDGQMLEGIKKALSGNSLFAQNALIIIRHPFAKKSVAYHDMLVPLLDHLPDTHFLVLDDDSLDAKSSLGKALNACIKKSEAISEEFEFPTGPALKKWIEKRAGYHAGSFEYGALSWLVASATELLNTKDASHLWLLDNEIQKLCSYAAQTPITKHDIQLVSCLPSTAHIFTVMDALLEKNKRESLARVHFATGTGETQFSANLLQMIGFLINQYRSFFIVKSMDEEGKKEDEIASALSWNSRRVWVIVKKLKLFSKIQLRDYYMAILECEKKIKTGAGDPLLNLDLLIHQLTS